MEIRRKEKTLAGIFSKYVALFCINTLLLVGGTFLIFLGLCSLGVFLPANYAETQLAENAAEIRKSGASLEKLIPPGCSYGVFDSAGVWLEGDFSGQAQEEAWMQYEKDSFYGMNGAYYRFFSMDNGNICIVKYHIRMRYSTEKLNSLLPPPEILMPVLDVILFVLNVVFLSRSFAGKLKVQLRELSGITEKIAENNLEFQTRPSEIKEINEVMRSLGHMKDALQDSLQRQWDMENQKQEQLSALAHDIKTPLTIVRGNAELLEEGDLPEEERECASYILTNVKEIEQYLETMRRVLQDTEQKENKKVLSCSNLQELFRETAKQLSKAEKIPVFFDLMQSEGEVCCIEENILRAWNNIVSNAAQHTDRQKGLTISIRQKQKDGHLYLVAAVRDYGAGFSQKDLQHAMEEFYSGDTSRHDRKHQGLGLTIAKRFIEEQGGFLEYKNNATENGAEVSLWINFP